jgi:hypothetical protein
VNATRRRNQQFLDRAQYVALWLVLIAAAGALVFLTLYPL